MTIAPFSPRGATGLFVSMRRDLLDLQRQLATGQKAESHGGLGFERRTSLDGRARLAAIENYTSAIDGAELRLKLMIQNLERIGKLASDTKSDMTLSKFELLNDGRTFAQKTAEQRFKEALDLLNADLAGRSLFSGRAVDRLPAETFERIMNGDGTRAGLKQLIQERTQAELGVNGMGRLFTSAGAASVTLSGEAPVPDFGFTVAGASATGAALTASLGGGLPSSATFSLSGQPLAGDTITVTLRDRDGTSYQVRLTASANPPQPGQLTSTFQIGGTIGQTVANLEAALQGAVRERAAAVLQPRAAMLTAENFFAATADNPPLRIAGAPPFTTATATRPGTAAESVVWYRGDADPTLDPRATAPVRVDAGQVVGVGARANEAGIRNVLAQLAVLTAESFANTPQDAARYTTLSERVFEKLSDKPANPKVSEIATELAQASGIMSAAKARHGATRNLLLDAVQGVELASKEETAAAILDLQNRLQASYQTTSILSRLTIVNYL